MFFAGNATRVAVATLVSKVGDWAVGPVFFASFLASAWVGAAPEHLKVPLFVAYVFWITTTVCMLATNGEVPGKGGTQLAHSLGPVFFRYAPSRFWNLFVWFSCGLFFLASLAFAGLAYSHFSGCDPCGVPGGGPHLLKLALSQMTTADTLGYSLGTFTGGVLFQVSSGASEKAHPTQAELRLFLCLFLLLLLLLLSRLRLSELRSGG